MSADDLIGIPYVLGGRDLDGADCLGVAILEAQRVGRLLRDPGVETVAKVRAGRSPASIVVADGWLRVQHLEPGDFLVMEEDGIACHCAMVRDARYAIQSNEQIGRSHRVPIAALLPHLDSAWRLPAC